MDSQTVRAKHKEFLFPCVANYYAEPVVITEAHGSSVKDLDGREYLDFARLVHTSSVYPTQEQVRVAERLTQITPGKLKKSFFTTSGTEANETAVMLAKIYTGQQEIIVLRHSYAGRSQGAIAITGQQPWRVLPTQIAGIKHALSPYCYRCPMGLEYPDCGIRCAQDIEDLIKTQTNGRPAAFMAEPIQGAGGFITPPQEYFEIAVGIVRKYGAVFICDEVQTAWGRTGDKWCGIEHWGVEPEIMTFAKSIANGFPVGATIATEEVANAFTGLSLSTFGGNPISMAAVDVTMDVMERENTPQRSAVRGAQLRDALEEFKKRFAFIGDVRGMGLMQGIELVEDRKTKEPSPKKTTALLEAAKQQGLLIGKGGLYGNVLRIAPSMLISKADIDDGCKRLERALAEVK